MLKPHRLDDQNFIDIVSRSRRLIQKYAADWTNENASDPGITILEMLSWLKDNMQYYMDQSHLISEKAYMDLLNIHPLTGKPSEMITTVRFTEAAEDDYLSGLIRQTQIIPKGFPVWADNTRFELASSAQVQVSNIVSVYTSDAEFKGSITDLIGAFENNAAAHPFGINPEQGKCLYIGFDDLRSGLVSFFVDVEDDPNGFRNPYDYEKISFAKGIWELAVSSSHASSADTLWLPLEMALDETHGFMNDGIVTLSIDPSAYIQKCPLFKGNESLVWIRYRLEEANYDRPPVIENIIMNAIRIKQEHTVLACHSLEKHTDNKDVSQILIQDYVPEGAEITLEIKTASGYKVINPSNYSVKHHENGTMTLMLNEHHESVDIARLRLISGDPKLGGIKTYNIKGLPFEEVDTTLTNILFDSFSAEVSQDYNTDKWYPWESVRHLWSSKSDDRHFVLHSDTGIIEFGNNELGMLPDSKDNALRIIEAKTSLKDKGNGSYKALYIDEVMGETYAFKPISKAINGRASETDEQAFRRFNAEIDNLTRMMSKSHIEEIIKATPGLAIRDVAVISGSTSSDEGRIIALPKSDQKNPELPPIYVDFIDKRIEETRLVTEHWKVTGPDYVSLKVKLEIIKDPAVYVDPENVRILVSRFIEPETGKLFGRRFSAGKLKRLLESLSGVLQVSRLSLRTLQGTFKRADGDIQLPDSAIAFLADIDLQILDDQGW